MSTKDITMIDPIAYSLAYNISKKVDNVPPVFRIKKTYMMSETEQSEYINKNPLMSSIEKDTTTVTMMDSATYCPNNEVSRGAF